MSSGAARVCSQRAPLICWQRQRSYRHTKIAISRIAHLAATVSRCLEPRPNRSWVVLIRLSPSHPPAVPFASQSSVLSCAAIRVFRHFALRWSSRVSTWDAHEFAPRARSSMIRFPRCRSIECFEGRACSCSSHKGMACIRQEAGGIAPAALSWRPSGPSATERCAQVRSWRHARIRGGGAAILCRLWPSTESIRAESLARGGVGACFALCYSVFA